MAYTNRHGVQSQNVLAVCDHDMRFVYVYAGWEGSAHDARVLDGALTGPNHFPMPPTGNTSNPSLHVNLESNCIFLSHSLADRMIYILDLLNCCLKFGLASIFVWPFSIYEILA